MFYNVVQL